MRERKLEEALAVFRHALETSPDSLAANDAAGIVLDLTGQGKEARKYLARAIDLAPTPQSKATELRAMAISYAFEANCEKATGYEQQAFRSYASVNDFYRQGEVANEAARICLESGDLNTARKWYKTGHHAGLSEPDIPPERKDLWNFRWESAQARIAIRQDNPAEARKHVAAAKSILNKGTNPQQEAFFPYLTGYIAFYEGDYQSALRELQQANEANQKDPFIQCLIGETYEKLGDKEKAIEYYRKASTTIAHTPSGAFARPLARKKLSSQE